MVEKTRWHEWEEGEPDDRESGHRSQGVAPLGEHVRTLEEKEDEHRDGHEEVSGAVVHVPELDEPALPEKGILDALLVEQTEETFEPDHPLGIVECVLGDAAGGDDVRPEPVPDPRVDDVERTDDQRLLPPEESVDSRGSIDGSAPLGHRRHPMPS